MLEKIKSPADIKALSYKELRSLAGEIRNKITSTVSENGGHLGSNLGTVEMTIAIHRVFDTPRDTVIFDVGHQCYAHKLITGRYGSFDTLRRKDGISGFLNAEESEYDEFTEGHSGASLSQALGMAAAAAKKDPSKYVIAVIGDGSFTNGMIYEALNNCVGFGGNLIIILNDNEMSISKNVGGMSSYLTRIRTSKKYFTVKHYFKRTLMKIPCAGRALIRFARGTRDFFKRLLVSYNLFECMGIDYIGPVDGNDLVKMEIVLKEAKTKDVCTLVHIKTLKGKGYSFAENDPESFHSTGAFDPETGFAKAKKKGSFSDTFGNALCALAEKDESICAVTAAMESGTGLSPFAKRFPDRLYDVGIAEEHALTFSAGLSKGGLKPVLALYSTFAQRTFDQLFHDVAIQNIPFVLCLDRAGLVEGDGITHQGIFDVAEFRSIPGVNIFSPETYGELENALESAVGGGVNIIRYPKGAEAKYDRSGFEKRGEMTVKNAESAAPDVVVFTYGRVTAAVSEAAALSGKNVKIVKLIKVHPLDPQMIVREAEGANAILVVEEGIKCGGIGESIASLLCENGAFAPVKIHAIDTFAKHGSLSELFSMFGFTGEYIAKEIAELAESGAKDDGNC